MIGYAFRRLVEGIPTIFFVLIVTFAIIHLAPGDPISYMVGTTASPEFLANAREKLGLDRPIIEQLLDYLGRVIRGDLGYSFTRNQPINSIILSRLPATLLLMITSFIFSVVVGISLGAIAARKPYGWTDNITMVFSLFTFSMPQFWVGMVLLLVFGLWLRILPIQGMTTVEAQLTGWKATLDTLKHLILPALALGLSELAVFVRMTRTSMLEIIEQDFIKTARSKGLKEGRVYFVHGLRNALISVVTIIGMRLRTLFAGAVLVETIFAWPGIGRLTLLAMKERDYPLILGITLYAALMVIITNFLTDVIYALVDPRIEYH